MSWLSQTSFNPQTTMPATSPSHLLTQPNPTEFKDKKVVIVAVPGAFTPTCQEQHLSSYLEHLDDLKAKGVDQVIFIASNDAWVMSAWGKANGINDEKIVCGLTFPHLTRPPLTWESPI